MASAPTGSGYWLTTTAKTLPPSSPVPSVLAECNLPTAGPVVQPSAIVLACGDGNASLTYLTWSSWTPTTAAATGYYRQTPAHQTVRTARSSPSPPPCTWPTPYRPLPGRNSPASATPMRTRLLRADRPPARSSSPPMRGDRRGSRVQQQRYAHVTGTSADRYS